MDRFLDIVDHLIVVTRNNSNLLEDNFLNVLPGGVELGFQCTNLLLQQGQLLGMIASITLLFKIACIRIHDVERFRNLGVLRILRVVHQFFATAAKRSCGFGVWYLIGGVVLVLVLDSVIITAHFASTAEGLM